MFRDSHIYMMGFQFECWCILGHPSGHVRSYALVEIDKALVPGEMGHILKIDYCYKSASLLHMIRI